MSPADEEIIGRRCDMGCATWPDDKAYKLCPVCHLETVRFRCRTEIPMSLDEAASAVNHIDFEIFYDTQWDRDERPITDAELIAMGISPKLPEGPGKKRPRPSGAMVDSPPQSSRVTR